MSTTPKVRFSFRFTTGNKELERTIQLLFSSIAQANLRGDITSVVRKHLTEIVFMLSIFILFCSGDRAGV